MLECQIVPTESISCQFAKQKCCLVSERDNLSRGTLTVRVESEGMSKSMHVLRVSSGAMAFYHRGPCDDPV